MDDQMKEILREAGQRMAEEVGLALAAGGLAGAAMFKSAMAEVAEQAKRDAAYEDSGHAKLLRELDDIERRRGEMRALIAEGCSEARRLITEREVRRLDEAEAELARLLKSGEMSPEGRPLALTGGLAEERGEGQEKIAVSRDDAGRFTEKKKAKKK